MRTFIVFLSLAYAVPAFPCSFDVDCDVGAKCIKSGFASDGVCVGGYGYGRQPRDSGAKYDDERGYGSKKGESCMGNYDCGVGGQCLKSGLSTYGTCTK